ncbi:MAG: TolC family protein [Ignavibacteriales bacterium]|nr:MAG: TolC family protein [Ignavibacteriales bacterium]
MRVLLSIILLIVFNSVLSGQQFTIEESIELGLKNSKDLKISGSKVSSSQAKISEVNSQMLPKLSLSASYTRLSDIPPFEIITPLSPNPIKLYDILLNNYNFKLSLQQPLFTGFRLSSLKNAAEFNSKSFEVEYDEEVNNAAFNIYTSFWNYFKAQQILKLVDENLSQMELHLEDTKNFLDNGLVTLNDLLKLEVEYSNTTLKKIDAENSVELSRAAFNKSIGIEINAPSTLHSKEINSSQHEYDFDEILNEAKQNRNTLKSVEYKILALEENIDASRGGWFPSIFLFGNFYYSNPNPRILPPEDKFNDTWDIGVGLSWDLWNWGFTSSQTRQAEETKYQAELLLSKLNDAVEMEVYQSYLNYKKSLEKINVIQKSVEQAEENYRITKEKYNSQLATSSDLIDAEISLLLGKTNLTHALVDYELSRLALEKTIGRKIY